MGTRNLTAVVLNGEYKVAQYGQWDGYPSGQGATALNFLRKKANREALKKALAKCQWITEQEVKEVSDHLGIGEWMDEGQAARFFTIFPFLSRDHGAKILEMIAKSKAPIIKLRDSLDFVDDSLFCEWAYIIDFDQSTFEVYKGFNKTQVPEGQRFATRPKNTPLEAPELDRFGNPKEEYFPIMLVKSYSLDALPTEKKFIKEVDSGLPGRRGRGRGRRGGFRLTFKPL